jgi:hypothetical protein
LSGGGGGGGVLGLQRQSDTISLVCAGVYDISFTICSCHQKKSQHTMLDPTVTAPITVIIIVITVPTIAVSNDERVMERFVVHGVDHSAARSPPRPLNASPSLDASQERTATFLSFHLPALMHARKSIFVSRFEEFLLNNSRWYRFNFSRFSPARACTLSTFEPEGFFVCCVLVTFVSVSFTRLH